ncbi:MAG: T9SS type A sorting domain-containing protein, partial [Ignavibacteriota bacterium]
LTGDIRGNLSALYIQSKEGTFYSVDQGVTWTSYCGPHNDFDSRMYNIGPDTLYAGTLEGQLWINPFGVRRNKDLLQMPNSPFDMISERCLSIDSLYKFTNLSNCLVVKLLNVSLVPGVGSNTFTFKKPIFPITLPDSSTTSLKITYTPDNNAADSAQLDISYSVGGEVFTIKKWIRGLIKPGYSVILSKDLNLLLSSDCSKLDTFITLTSGLCAEDTLLAVTLSDPTAFSIIPPLLPNAIAVGKSLKIPVSIKTLPAGPYSAFITLTIRSGGITRDTIINLSAVILAATDLRTNLSPGKIKFDSVSICGKALDTIVLKNTICKDLVIKNISISPPPAALEFSVLGILRGSGFKIFPDTVAFNSFDSIVIQYKPTLGGLVAGSVVLTIGLDLLNTKDTSIQISGIGKAFAGSALESNILAFDPIEQCQSQELSTHLYNNSCGIDTLIGIIPSRDLSFFALKPAPPLVIASGDSTLITISEDPTSAGAKFDSVGLIIHSSTGAIDTVIVKLSGIVNQPVHRLSLDMPLVIDSLTPCTLFDTLITIRNLSTCDTLSVDSLSISGPAWFSTGNIILSRNILPDSVFVMHIYFTPGSGASANGTLHFMGRGIDTILQIHASSRTGGPLYTLNNSTTTFISSLCKPALRTYTFSNTSCDTIILDDLSLKNNLPGGTQFTFTPLISLPDTIVPGKKVDIVVTFDPLGKGDSTAVLSFHSTVNNITSITKLTGSLSSSKQIAHLELVVGAASKTVSALAGSAVGVRLVLQDAVGDSLGFTQATATLSYDDDVLSVLGTPQAGAGWKVNSTTPAKGALTLNLGRTNGTSLPPGTEMATIQFEPYIAVNAATPMDLQNLSFNSGDPAFASCVLAPLALAPIVINVSSECGSDALRGLLRGEKPIIDGIIIHPNPAASGTVLTIGLQLNQHADLKLVLRNVLGEDVMKLTRSGMNKGEQNILLSLPAEASGLYILSIEAGGFTESRKIVIEK